MGRYPIFIQFYSNDSIAAFLKGFAGPVKKLEIARSYQQRIKLLYRVIFKPTYLKQFTKKRKTKNKYK